MIRILYVGPTERSFVDTEFIFQELLNRNPHVVGLDTETTVHFNSALDTHKLTSVLQVCVRENSRARISNLPVHSEDAEVYSVFIVHLKHLHDSQGKLPSSLIKFFNAPDIIKVGAAIQLDAENIKKSYGIKIQGIVNIQDLARSMGISKISLNDLAEKYLNLNKLDSKLGNYDTTLTNDQIEYAAYDAYLSLAIYQKMLNIPLKSTKPYFYTPENDFESKFKPNDVNIDKFEAVRVFNFLQTMKVFSPNEGVYFEKIFNVIKNSYADWNHDLETASLKLQQALNILTELKYLNFNDGMWSTRTSEQSSEIIYKERLEKNYHNNFLDFYNMLVSLTKRIITVDGIKKGSLIKMLANSTIKIMMNNKEKQIIKCIE
ncbi:MAG TPA: 3'-5' exonuclease, partial [Aquella sp.]|nr:3'-5' exonuclease [Aquella sp.]